MPGLIEILDGGIGNSIQDKGRFGFRHMGIAVSGCIDAMLARSANALVGNTGQAACIEIRAVGPTLQVKNRPIRMALAGNIEATLKRTGQDEVTIAAWQSFMFYPEDILQIGFLASGAAYLAVEGGINTPVQLNSRSTYQRAMIGGINGQPIASGQQLPCLSSNPSDKHQYLAHSQWSSMSDEPIRVILGPQENHFLPTSVETFLNTEYQASKEMDRMGVRLEGAKLEHTSQKAADIVSDGITPGAIQVPGNGFPIILLADCQTVGGYPKIATVIGADMPRLAQLKAGDPLRFTAVSLSEARQALIDLENKWKAWQQSIRLGILALDDSSYMRYLYETSSD